MDQVSQIRDAIDIVTLLGEYITVTKAGKNFKALCPFHNEKSPSFIINPDRQRWHCFGCNKGGDCYAFLMDYERMEFPEALRFLADRAGITLISQSANTEQSSQKEKIYRINGLVKEYYHYLLTKHSIGKQALHYLSERGMTAKLIETFCLGFAPASGTALTSYLLRKKHYSADDLVTAGLAFQGRSGLVDFFRGRLMFPLIDHRDNVIGFSGRIIEQNDAVGKYVNTRETLAYHKSEHFFGLNVTKDALRKANQAIIVEGEFDVISCFAHGVSNVVGVKGTALTEQHVNLLARYVQKVTFCFDGDRAGQEAIKRSLAIVEKKGLSATVIVIPEAKDPDDALKTEPGLFKKAVKEDLGIYDYLLDNIVASSNVHTAEGKMHIVAEFLSFVILIQNEIVKEHYLRRLSEIVGISYESISKEMQKARMKQQPSTLQKVLPKAKRPKVEMLEEYVLALIVQGENSAALFQTAYAILEPVFITERARQKIVQHLATLFAETTVFSPKAFGETLPSELHDHYDRSLLAPLPEFVSEEKRTEEVIKTANSLRILYIQQQMKKLALEMHSVEDADSDRAAQLQQEYSRLLSLLDTA